MSAQDPVSGTYAVRRRRSAGERIRREASRLLGAFLGRTGGERYPYTDAGGHPRPDRTLVGACPICFNSCPVNYHLQGGRITSITGIADDPVTAGRLWRYCQNAASGICTVAVPIMYNDPCE